NLKAKIATWLSIAEPENLDIVIQSIYKIKAEEYYNKKDKKNKTQSSNIVQLF
ncbi:33679_t:CDS:1, partial [Racocetra persica]